MQGRSIIHGGGKDFISSIFLNIHFLCFKAAKKKSTYIFVRARSVLKLHINFFNVLFGREFIISK